MVKRTCYKNGGQAEGENKERRGKGRGKGREKGRGDVRTC